MLTTLTAVLICLYLGVALTALAVVVIACHDHRSICLPVWLFCLGVFVLISLRLSGSHSPDSLALKLSLFYSQALAFLNCPGSQTTIILKLL